jgi:site-specific DNA-adenine methylase
VFLDPPYFSETLLGRDNYSDKYTQKVFGLREHTRLARRLRELADRRVDFVLTNSAERDIVQLYKSLGLRVSMIEMPRAINSRTDQRKGAQEIVVTPGEAPDPAELEGAVLLDLEALGWRARKRSTASADEGLAQQPS